LSFKSAHRIADHLKLDPVDRVTFLAPFQPNYQKQGRHQTKQRKLSTQEFGSIADPLYFAFIYLTRTKGFRNNPDWIAKRLRIRSEQVTQIIHRLKHQGILREVDGQIEIDENSISLITKDNSPDQTLKKFHLELLRYAKGSLEYDKTERRDFTNMVFSADPEKLPAARELIRKFQDEIFALMSTEESTDVFNLSIQLFPMTTKD
jgi:uncharacterized protein (TIGR02147 family)